MMNESALFSRQLVVEDGLRRYLERIGVDSWRDVPTSEHESHRNALLGLGFMIKGNGDIEPVGNSVTFTSIHSQ